jgi:hypothetical protein
MIKLLKSALFTYIFFLFISCSKEAEIQPTLSSEKDITSFVIPNIVASIDRVNNKIIVFVPASTTNLNFNVTITISNGSRLNYSLNGSIDFNVPVEFTVTAQDGSSKKYVTEIVRQEGIKSFKIKITNPFFDDSYGVINTGNKTITVDITKDYIFGFTQSIKTVVFETTPGCTTNIVSGSVIDINNPSDLILTKSNGTIEVYNVKIRNIENNIRWLILPSTSFTPSTVSISSYQASYYPSNLTVGLLPTDLVIRTLVTENLSNVIPKTIRSSINSTVSPSPNLPQNFNQDVVYTVTSESGNIRNIKVRVLKVKIIIDADLIQTNSVSGGGFFYYVGISKIASIKFIKDNTNEEVTGSIYQNYIHNNTDEYYLNYGVPSTTTSGSYNLRVTLENGDVINTYYKIIVS